MGPDDDRGQGSRWLKAEGDSFARARNCSKSDRPRSPTSSRPATPAASHRRRCGATCRSGALAVRAPSVPDAEIAAFVPHSSPEPTAERRQRLAPRDMRPAEVPAGARNDSAGGDAGLIHSRLRRRPQQLDVAQTALAEVRRAVALDLPGMAARQGSRRRRRICPRVVADAIAAWSAGSISSGIRGGAIAQWRRAGRIGPASLIATAGLGRINGVSSFVRAEPPRGAEPCHVGARPGPQPRDDRETLRYKRSTGLHLETIARAWFPDGRQARDLLAELGTLPVPIQLIWGEDDRIIPIAHAEALAGKLEVHIVDGVGHLPHMEKSGEVNRLIGRFIEAHP